MKLPKNIIQIFIHFSILLLVGAWLSVATAQILQKDTLNIDARYELVKYTNNTYSYDMQNVDTVLLRFQEFNQALKHAYQPLWLSNMGQAHQHLVFAYNNNINFNLGYQQYQLYQFKTDSVRYFKSPFPYANWKYVMGSRQQQFLNLSFSQPISRHFNYNVHYRLISTPGVYNHERARHNNFYASTWYKSPNMRYNMLTHYMGNRARVEQNGGVYSDYITSSGYVFNAILDTTIRSKNLNLATQLESAETTEKNQQIFIQNTYDWGTYYDTNPKKKKAQPENRDGAGVTRENLRGAAPPVKLELEQKHDHKHEPGHEHEHQNQRPTTTLKPKPENSAATTLKEVTDSTLISPKDSLNKTAADKAKQAAARALAERNANRKNGNESAAKNAKQKKYEGKSFFPTMRLGHNFTYKNQRYFYLDESASLDSEGQSSPIYKQFLIDPTQTQDSLQARQFQNEFFVALFGKKKNQNKPGYSKTYMARGGFKHNLIRTTQFKTQDTIPVQIISIDNQQTDTYLDSLYYLIDTTATFNTGIINFKFASNPNSWYLRYGADAEYALFGYNLADFTVNGWLQLFFSQKIGGIRGRIAAKNLTPSHISQFYFSNHFRWQNDFKKINSLQLWATYYNPQFKSEFTYANHTINNYLLYNNNAEPEQLSTVVNISQFILQNRYNWRKWYFQNTLVFQLSSSDKIQIPAYYGRHSVYFQSYLFKSSPLLLQIGLDAKYNTNYYANAYMPSTGQFYTQFNEQLTYYPVFDAFLNVRVQKVRLFLKLEHLNQGLFPQKNYFTAPNYAMPDRMFRFGFSWVFYD